MPNYNILTGALQTINLQHDRTLGNDGNIFNTDVSDGMHSLSKVIGAEFNYNLGEGWKLEEKIRYAANGGQFVAPFPASVSKGSDFFNTANFANFGSAVYAGTNTPVDMNANYMKIALFNVKLNNFNNFVNDFNISKKWDVVKFNAGLYKSSQNINMSWMWNNYLQEVSDKNARLIDVKNTAGQYITDNGLLNYGMKDWGNLKRDYNTKYDITAPHAQVEINATDKLTIDAGARYDIGKVTGYFSGATVTYTSRDMNGNGVIDIPEQMVGSNDNINIPVNYRYGIFGYSVGANYALNNKNAVFARVSRGGSASADRILFSGYNYTNNDDPALDAVKVNKVHQVEAGYKLRGSGYFLNTTLFYAGTKEANYEATTQKKTENKYQSFGVELDGYYKITQGLDVKAGLTYTHAEIKNAIDPTIIGNMPRRTPKLMYSVNPNFNVNKFNIGFYLIGATKAFTQDNNKLVMPGYAIVNPYISYQVLKNLSVSLNANNVFNSIAVTEAEEGSIAGGNGIVRARTLPGASYSVSVKFDL
ncbi:TonB-dependent receptor domain-containing protein [Chryseobacterium taichungense]|uniref:TonB-dependent receptor domain-containing protein n=1 Tax=Chryseobacterium taichungense TaxID=295069 RepID=UPI0035E402F6